MHHRVPVRLLGVALAAGSLLLLPLAGSASAGTLAKCAKFSSGALNSKTETSKGAVSGCSPTSITGSAAGTTVSVIKTYKVTTGKGKGTYQAKSTTTWTTSKKTTIAGLKYTLKAYKKGDGCPASFGTGTAAKMKTIDIVTSNGTVTGGTNTKIPVGTPVSAHVCINGLDQAEQVPGTVETY
jgi:hypothetical protein